MPVRCIDDIAIFEELKPEWEKIYQADPTAHIFVSWPWLRGYFDVARYRWIILAFSPEPAAPYTAFLPLTVETRLPARENVLRIGGAPVADYTGLICLPGDENAAIPAFAEYLKHELAWDTFHLKDVLDPRLEKFLQEFSGAPYAVEAAGQISCPSISLPDTWDRYLEEIVGWKIRKNIRYYTRKIEALENFRVSRIQDENFDSQIETLLSRWADRWGEKPDIYRAIFRRCFDDDRFTLTIFWDADTPVAALAAFVDGPKKTLSDFLTWYNTDYAKLSPGMVIHAYSIREAIENGMLIYDFLRGREEYKYALGATERLTSTHIIRRRTLKRIVKQWIKKWLAPRRQIEQARR